MASPVTKARLWNCVAPWMSIAIVAVPRLTAAHERVAAWRRLGERTQLYRALAYLASECAVVGAFDDADRALSEAKALEDAAWPPRRRWEGADVGTWVSVYRGDAAAYREGARLALALAEQGGMERAAAVTRLNLADAALMAGDAQEAIEVGRAAVDDLRALDLPTNLGIALSNLCAALLVADDLPSARFTAADALPLAWQNETPGFLFNHLALVAARGGAYAEAAQMLGFADARYAANQEPRQPNEARSVELAATAIDATLGRALHAELRIAGASLSDAQAEALARGVLGESVSTRA